MKSKHINENDLNMLLNTSHHDPFLILGPGKLQDGGVIVRAFFPDVKDAFVIEEDTGKETKMEKLHQEGIYEAFFPDKDEVFKYKIKKVFDSGHEQIIYDPYSFLPILSDFDRHLMSKGDHHKTYEKLGSHIMEVNDIKGVHFAVWAPTAKRVSVVGDFNNWDGRKHQMRVLGESGIWEIFIPEVQEGNKYKYEIKTASDMVILKSDPHAFYSEIRPNTASVVYDITGYEWEDKDWIKNRESVNLLEEPINIYEVHLGSWMRIPEEDNRVLTYREIAPKLVDYMKDMGYTHIELLPITEYPYDGSWGYQVLGYFAPTSRYGEPKDFMWFVEYLHKHDIGVILDWVPAHFPKDSHGLSYFDGSPMYEYADTRKGEHADWGTLVFDYGRYEVSNFLISSGLFWLEKYHIDGLRVDAVASMLYLDYGRQDKEWVPNEYGGNENLEAVEFVKKFNELVHKYHKGVMTIAEESTAWAGVTKPVYVGGLGFTFKWNMGWMNDTLEYIKKDPIYRKYHHDKVTFGLVYAFSEHYILPLSHDEVVHGKGSMINKMPGDDWQKFANLRAYFGLHYTHPGKKILFMGGEFGMFNEWYEARSIDWHLLDNDLNAKLHQYMKDLMKLYNTEKPLHNFDYHWATFEWIDGSDADNNVFSYIRKAKDQNDYLIVVFNFSPIPRFEYRIATPHPIFYKEVLNSDSEMYGGSNLGNDGGKMAENIAHMGKQYSMSLTLPPISVVVFKPDKKELNEFIEKNEKENKNKEDTEKEEPQDNE